MRSSSRVPELRAFVRHPEVARALENGRPHEAWAALRSALRRNELGEDAADAALLVARRRSFVEPARAPWTFTFHGFGTQLLGEDERDDEDGSHIATLFLVAFLLPIFPLAQYLVIPIRGNAWNFVGKVPTSTFIRAWRALAFAAMGALLATWAVRGWHGVRFSSVTVVNALPFPVDATVGAHRLAVAAGAVATEEFPVALYPVVVKTLDGRVVDRGRIDVRGDFDVFAWNVAGLGAIERETLVYRSDHARPGPDIVTSGFGRPRSFCGERVVRLEDVDYAFVAPATNIRIPRHHPIVERRVRVGLASTRVAHCVESLLHSPRPERGAALGANLLVALDYEAEATLGVVSAMIEAGLTTGLVALAETAVAKSGDLDAHRALGEALVAEHRAAEAIERYRAGAAREPRSGDASYLLAALLDDAEVAALAPELTTRFPEHARLRFVIVHAYLRLGRYADAVREFEVLETLDLPLWASDARAVADAYTGARIPTDLLASLVHAHAVMPSAPVVAVYATLAPAGATPTPVSFMVDLLRDHHGDRTPAVLAAMLADAGRSVREGPPVLLPRDAAFLAELEAITRALGTSGADALSVASRAGDSVIATLQQRSTLVLASEALRIDPNHPLVARLLELHPDEPVLRAVVSFVRTGRPTRPFRELPPSVRGLATVAYAARPNLPEATRAELRASAVLGDVGTGIVHLSVARALASAE